MRVNVSKFGGVEIVIEKADEFSMAVEVNKEKEESTLRLSLIDLLRLEVLIQNVRRGLDEFRGEFSIIKRRL